MKNAARVRSSWDASSDAAIVTSRPPGFSTPHERCRVSPPTVLHGGHREANLAVAAEWTCDWAEELEELRGPHDGKRNLAPLDQLLLSDLGTHIPAVRQAISRHHRQRDVVPHARAGWEVLVLIG